jgi:hypothetical protein
MEEFYGKEFDIHKWSSVPQKGFHGAYLVR